MAYTSLSETFLTERKNNPTNYESVQIYEYEKITKKKRFNLSRIELHNHWSFI